MGVTHHSNYFRFMEEARIDFMEKVGWSYDKFEEEGVSSPVMSVEGEYKKSTTYPDVITIDTHVIKMSRFKITLEYKMYVKDELVFRGTSVNCFLGENGPVCLEKQYPGFYEKLKEQMVSQETALGREIEIKIPLEAGQFERIYEAMTGVGTDGIKFGKTTHLYKKDEYYSLYDSREERLASDEPQVIRIRTEDDGVEEKAYFTLKRKTKQNGIELNKEDETYVEDADVLRDLLSFSKYKCWFKKEKDAFSSHCNSSVLENVDFHLELEKVNGMPYVELEVTDESGDADKIKIALGEFVKLLGLNPDKKDSRSWIEIINSNKQAC